MSVPADFYQPLDLHRNELQNAVLQNLASPPSSPAEGQAYFDTALVGLGIYDGSQWVYLGSGTGSVTTVSVVSANGFAGSVANASTTPAITITTTVTGLLKGNGTAISAAVAGTDYLTPTGSGSGLTALNGSQITTGTVSAARLPALDGITSPAGNVSLNGQKITNLANGTASADAVTYGQFSVAIQGQAPKPTAAVATAAALPACTYGNGTSGVGATLTANANGALTVDGYAVAAGDVVLVKNQSAGLQNGLYDVTQAGDGTHPFILTRDADMDTSAEFAGAYVVVENLGATLFNSFWLCSNTSVPTVGTTAITFAQLNGATQLAAGTGVTISGNTVSVSASYAGQTSITTLGTITTGTWTGTAIAVANGGTGASTARNARINLSAPGKYTALIGDGSSTTFTITQATHGLAADDTNDASVYDASTKKKVYPGIQCNANGDVVITFNTTTPASNAFRVKIYG
jgi:hypothetical protein